MAGEEGEGEAHSATINCRGRKRLLSVTEEMDNDATIPSSPSSYSASLSTFVKKGSCELNSRLKTRKLLGVGETNDGDVHRSKLSQILGHSEQLYFKETRGLRFWQLFSSLLYSCLGLSEFVCPGSILCRPQATDDDVSKNAGVDPLTTRLYAAALLSLSVMLWRSSLSVDRELMRVSLLTSVIYSILHLIVCTVSLLWSSPSSRDHVFVVVVVFSLEFLQLIFMLIFFAVSLYFYRSTTK